MANKRVDPEKKVYPLWASVTIDIKTRIEREAGGRGMTPAKLAGEVLTEWTIANCEPLGPDERQGELFVESGGNT